MDLDIYTSTKNWKYTELDQLAEERFSRLEEETRATAPENFYHKQTLTHLEFMRSNKLYPLLKTLPKGVMHHCHFDCAEDEEFYRKYIINDPIVYLAPDRRSFRLGTKQQAEAEGWVSMQQERQAYPNEAAFVRAIASITMLNKEQLLTLSYVQREMWNRFEVKIGNFFPIFFALHIFKKYTRHVLLKFIANGYERLEFRAFLCTLNEYDAQGNLLKNHSEAKFMQAFDQVYAEVRQQHPNFTVGFVFFGLKVFTPQQNEELFQRICQLKWDKTIGLDFVQEEDLFGSLEEYDPIIDRVLARHAQLDYKKVYHAGETRNHRTHNLDIAVKAGSVRIGHGFNILQRIEFLPHCKNICFEKNPLSNVVLGYNTDARQASAPILLGLGYAVTINPDDPGKFGVQDSTVDYFLSAISYNWTLRHLKLIAYHSINHAICDQHTRASALRNFEDKWDRWIRDFLQGEHGQATHRWAEPDIYSNARNWSWNEKEEQAKGKFETVRNAAIDSLPEGFYQEKVLSHLSFMHKSPLYALLKDLPKGALHHDHFDCNEDQEFYRKYIITDPTIFLTPERDGFRIGTAEQAVEGKWISWSQMREELGSEEKLVQFVSSLTMITPEEMLQVAGNAKLFWIPFELKITRFMVLLQAQHIFRKYSEYVLRKFYHNGYSRIEFRALLWGLNEYDQKGNLLKQHEDIAYARVFDEAFAAVTKDHPDLSVGFIFFGLKAFSDEQNDALLTRVCELGWAKTVGIDFVQEQNPYGSLDKYDRVADRVLERFPELNLKKVYHAGDTCDHRNDNIEVAVRAGSVRIGHGLNIIQRIEFLPHCSSVCFELNPISNLITASSARTDLRLSSAPILLGLGYPISISPDDPGKFGYEDTTVDFFASAVSFNWTLKHLKLACIHSINHAVCTEGARIKLLRSFRRRWDEWIDRFLAQ